MNIKVIGTGCDKCDTLYENVLIVLNELDMDAEVEKVEDLVEIVKLGVMSSPSLMIDGKLVASGRVAKKDELKKILSK
ncbi:thioredoxin family protein [Peptacetobacter hominis]|uniref:Thioredoxin family protein n=1 Tax=Peptacetobacter hominis TaxID=2743610 RepID=A0A544QT70_9FIRM|nr:thioredoxin family protein [Peptacetobacter hominis]TQQ83887.1 thioredoxin family protein [Peptacetobacter hominis]